MQHVKELSQAPSKVNLKQTTLNSIPNSPTKFNVKFNEQSSQMVPLMSTDI